MDQDWTFVRLENVVPSLVGVRTLNFLNGVIKKQSITIHGIFLKELSLLPEALAETHKT